MSPPLYIYNNKILVDGNKLRGCCCNNDRWRIIRHKSTSNNNNCPGDGGAEVVYYQGNIVGNILKQFPRRVNYKGWTNEFPDAPDSYDHPCVEDQKLTLEMLENFACFFTKNPVIEQGGKVVKTITRISPDNVTDTAIYEFISTKNDNTGSIAPNANGVPERCKGQGGLPAAVSRSKKVRYTITRDPENGTCCLTNPQIVEAESTICVVFCCNDANQNPKGTTKSTTFTDCLKLQIFCDGQWKDVDNPGLNAPTGPGAPGTGHTGIGDGWCIPYSIYCPDQPSCAIPCDGVSIKANFEAPPFLEIGDPECYPA
ncbi:hypothetical protein EBU24_03575 [bacterium]|nr:hypothetical protein [bacterium]